MELISGKHCRELHPTTEACCHRGVHSTFFSPEDYLTDGRSLIGGTAVPDIVRVMCFTMMFVTYLD